jgi:hypothetical protein
MNSKKSIQISLFSVLVLLALVACSGSKSSKFPTGKFVNASDSSKEVEYTADNTWAYYMGGLMSAKGSYQVDGNLWIEQGTPECPYTGTYEWTYDGNNLSFKLSGVDSCAPRVEATDGQTFVLSK